MRILNKILDFFGFRSSDLKCKKCGCQRFKVEFDGSYTDYIVCKCCGHKVEGSEVLRI